MPTPLTKQHPPLSLDHLKGVQDELNISQVIGTKLEEELRTLVRSHPLLNYVWQTGHVFWRGQPRNSASERYTNVRRMMWPPAAEISQSRANLKGESILYVADHLPTVVAELCSGGPCPMQFVGMEIRPEQRMRFLPVGEISEIWDNGKSLVTRGRDRANAVRGVLAACAPQEVERLVLADKILFDAFSHPNRRDLAAVIANEIRRKLPDVDGIMYRSVKRNAAFNLALQPKSVMSKCNIVTGFVADTCTIDSSGKCKLGNIEGLSGVADSGEFLWTGRTQADTKLLGIGLSLPVSKYDLEPFC